MIEALYFVGSHSHPGLTGARTEDARRSHRIISDSRFQYWQSSSLLWSSVKQSHQRSTDWLIAVAWHLKYALEPILLVFVWIWRSESFGLFTVYDHQLENESDMNCESECESGSPAIRICVVVPPGNWWTYLRLSRPLILSPHTQNLFLRQLQVWEDKISVKRL